MFNINSVNNASRIFYLESKIAHLRCTPNLSGFMFSEVARLEHELSRLRMSQVMGNVDNPLPFC